MPTRILRHLRPPLVLFLAFSMVLAPGAFIPAFAQEGRGGVYGTLYQADGSGKLAGAKVIAINVKTNKQYVSNVTTNNGDYEVSGLPAGTYDIAIDTGEGMFVADNLVDLNQNQHLSVSYSVQPMRPANRKLAGLEAPKGSATPIGGSHGAGDAMGEYEGGGRSFWRSPGGIVLISVLAVGAALAINNANDSNASPSAP